MEQIKGIIFDMDGVLLDTETISWRNWEDAAKELGIKDIAKANSKCMGANRDDTISILKSIYGQNFDAQKFLTRTAELFIQAEENDGIPLMPYVKETLEYLSKKYTLALASSTKKEAVYRQLKNAGIFDYFKTITTGDMVEHSKPDPEIYLKAIASINLKAEECAAIEDSPNGIRSAFAAGLYTIMVPDKIQPNEEMQEKSRKIISGLNQISTIL